MCFFGSDFAENPLNAVDEGVEIKQRCIRFRKTAMAL
jgi:hypothetical protein